MFRIIGAEIKKTFLKPGIFILTGILIVVLFACSILYSPTTRDSSIVDMKNEYKIASSINSPTIQTLYNYFNTSVSGENTKAKYDDALEKWEDQINFYDELYYGSGAVSINTVLLSNLNNDLAIIQTNWSTFYEAAHLQNGNIETSKENLYNSLNNLESDIYTIVSTSIKYDTLLISTETFDKITELLKTCKSLTNPITNTSPARNICDTLESNNFYNKLKNFISEFKEFKPSEEILLNLKSYITEAKSIIGTNPTYNSQNLIEENTGSGILLELATFVQNNASKTDAETIYKFDKIITKYKLITTVELARIVDYSILKDVLSVYSPNEIANFKNNTIKVINYYEICEDLARQEYLLQTKTYEFEYANPLSINQSSNENINAFDFSYFALRLCSFIIIVYCVVLAAGSIAGEQQAGTLKLLAIRPYSRSKLFLGKLLATFIIGIILLSLSAVATLIAGVISYSFSSLPILMVFNGTSAFSVSVFVEYLIMLASMFFELAFFADLYSF